MQAKIVTFEDDGALRPGGMCSCCGSGPNPEPDWRGDPWYVYKAGLCDSDGVYFSMLCEGCLEEIREVNADRPQTTRDEAAEIVRDLLGDDLDGAQAMMEDLALIEHVQEPKPLFELGHVVMTMGVEANTTEPERLHSLQRHVTGDWGEVPEEDARQNEWALRNDARILSAYTSATRVRFWIITEADRSTTTLLLPEEY